MEYVPAPKSADGQRKSVLLAFVVEVLIEHCTRRLEERLQAVSARENHDLVFSNVKGNFLNFSRLSTNFHKLLKKAKFRWFVFMIYDTPSHISFS